MVHNEPEDLILTFRYNRLLQAEARWFRFSTFSAISYILFFKNRISGNAFGTPTCRVQNPDLPQAGWVGAHGGVAGRGRAGLGTNITVRLRDEPPSYPPQHRRHIA